MNNLQLKALRQGLGLTVADASELAGVAKRTFQRWEDGSRAVANDVAWLIDGMASHYALVLGKMLTDVEKVTTYNKDDDTKPSRISPTLPFFHTFESFQVATECSKVAYWRIYQSVISQLMLIGKISKLDDDKAIPDDFWIWSWLGGAYEHDVH